MATEIATATIRIEPELPTLAASVRALVADELRRMADELSPVAPAAPPRYVLVKDRTGDYGIRDTELDIVADYGIDDNDDREDIDEVRDDLRRLNSGELQRRDIVHPFTPVN
jgi:hypothetical protein